MKQGSVRSGQANRIAAASRFVALVALAWLAAPAVSTTAAPTDDMKVCIEASGEPAVIACTRAIASNAFQERDLASLHAMRGAELSRTGQHDLALADYDQAIKIEPSAASIYTGRANVYLAKGDGDRAIADYSQAIKLDPQFVMAHYGRGNAHAIKGAMENAIADYSQAIRLDRQFAAAYVNRGNARAAESELGAALNDYDQALRLDPKLASVYGNRGMVYLKLDQFDRAIADYDTALKLDPDQPYAQYGRGIARLKKGDTGGNADIAAAKTRQGGVAEVLASAGMVVPGSAPAPDAGTGSAPAVSVKAVFEKHNLLGFFAPDCSKPVSKDNLYYVNRMLGDFVQTDQMSGATARDFFMVIDNAGEMSATEIVVTGTRDGRPLHMLWRFERAAGGAGMRVRAAEVSWDGKKLVSGQRRTSSGREMPWLQRCGAPG
jgi:tetratricopeptide (TPR) repeat protein